MRAVIMAGGEGTRLRPLTCDIPKPMVRLCGREVLLYILDLLNEHGFKKVDITLRYLPDMISKYFDDTYKDMSLSFVEENSPLGTAGGVRNAYKSDEDVLIISGDAICDFNLREIMRAHRESKADATVVVKKVSDPREYGLVDMDKDNIIKLFIEKPDYSQAVSDLANTGVYVLSKSALDLIPRGREFDFSKDLFPLMMKNGMGLSAFEESGYWCDIGDFDSYRSCQEDMILGRVKCTLGDGEIINNSYISRASYISNRALIEEYSVIDDGVSIGEGARVTGSIVLKNASIGERAKITGSILCMGSSIKRKAMLFDGAVIGRNAVVSDKATVMSGVKLWPYKELPIGAVASENIKTSKGRLELFDERGVSGQVGTELTAELASRLGAAIGTLGLGAVVVSAMDNKSSDMLKSALMAGIQSSGAIVADIGTSSQGEFNFAMCFLDVSLGVYISSENDSSIEIFAEGGLPLTRDMERKLEGILSRGEQRRCDALSTGERLIIREMRGFYHDMLRGESKGLEGARIQIKSTAIAVRDEAIRVLESMGARDDLGEVYQIAGKGNRLSIYGREIGYLSYRKVLLLCCLIELSKGNDVAVPFDAPMVLDALAKRYDKKVYRYLSCPAMGEDSYARELAKSQLWTRDALLMTIKIVDYLNMRGITLKELLMEIPSFGTAVKTVHTGTGAGELLRWLKNENSGILSEGIILSDKRGDVLIKPMKRGTGVRIYAEAMRYETAFELCDDMSEYIKNRKNNN